MFLTALESIFSDCATLEERLAACRQAGFDGIDLREHAQDAPAASRLTQRYGLKVGMIYSALPLPLLSRTAIQRAAAVEILAEKVYAAGQLGARGVVIVPVFGEARILPSSGDDVRTAELVLLNLLLGELEERLTNSGVYLAIEPLNRKETHLFHRPSEVAQWLRDHPRAGVQTMADAYHMHVEHQDAAAEIQASKGLLGCVHLSDPERALPGPNAIDFPRLFHQLRADRYDGPLGYECRPYPTNAIAKSVRLVRQMWDHAEDG